MSWLFCCFKTLSLCGLRDCMINSAAFQPPVLNKYKLKYDRDDLVKGPVYKIMLPRENGEYEEAQDMKGTESSVVLLETKTHSQIPALFIENKNSKSNVVILYSHGNSTDLGRMLVPLQELSYSLNIHVFAYEYTGYGPTKGSVGEIEIIYGITAAYEFLTKRLGFKWHYIILYGRSIGSGPAVYLATHPEYPVSGVILHSPIASGFRVFDFNFEKTHPTDLFPNCEFIEHAKAHVFIMHGEADTEVPITHGKLLESKCKNAFPPWWVPEGDHNNIDYTFKKLYYLRLGKFLRYIRDFNLEKTSLELSEFYRVGHWWNKSNHIYFKRVAKVEESYKKYIQKNAKNTREGSFVFESSMLTQRSANDKMLHAIIDSTNSKEMVTIVKDKNRDIDEQEPQIKEIQAYNPPKLLSTRSSSVTKKPAEIEFASYSLSPKVQYLEEKVEEAEEQGPREVRFKSTKIMQKDKENTGEEEQTTAMPNEQESTYMRTFLTKEE